MVSCTDSLGNRLLRHRLAENWNEIRERLFLTLEHSVLA